MSKESKLAVYRQQEQAAKWQRENRALWAESATGFVSLDDFEIQLELGVSETNPEYMLEAEQAGESLEDWLAGVDYDSAATESQSAVSSFNAYFNKQ